MEQRNANTGISCACSVTQFFHSACSGRLPNRWPKLWNYTYYRNCDIYIYIYFYFRFKNLGDATRKVMAFDKLSIICPNLVQYPNKRKTSFSKDLLYQNVYLVDETGYNNCNSTGGLSILSCDDPTKYSHATIVFQPSTADINDPKFKQGKAYYFISKCIVLQTIKRQKNLWQEWTWLFRMCTKLQKVPSCLKRDNDSTICSRPLLYILFIVGSRCIYFRGVLNNSNLIWHCSITITKSWMVS